MRACETFLGILIRCYPCVVHFVFVLILQEVLGAPCCCAGASHKLQEILQKVLGTPCCCVGASHKLQLC